MFMTIKKLIVATLIVTFASIGVSTAVAKTWYYIKVVRTIGRILQATPSVHIEF